MNRRTTSVLTTHATQRTHASHHQANGQATEPCGGASPDALFRVDAADPTYTCIGSTTAAQGTCFTTFDGSCITDGIGNYGNNERCTISVLQDTYLNVSGTFIIQGCISNGCRDFFRIDNSTPFATASSLNGVFLPAGTILTWQSNGNTVGAAWTLCGSVCDSANFMLACFHAAQSCVDTHSRPPSRRASHHQRSCHTCTTVRSPRRHPQSVAQWRQLMQCFES
jgi:hypothetical protein